MGEGLSLHRPLEGEKGGAHRVLQAGIGDHHVEDRLSLVSHLVPKAQRLEHPPRRRRDATHGLIGELRHSLQDRPALTAWVDGPNWIATVKRGLTGVWNRVTTMISGVHECQDLIEQTSFTVVESGATYYQLGAGAPESASGAYGGRGGLEAGGGGGKGSGGGSAKSAAGGAGGGGGY